MNKIKIDKGIPLKSARKGHHNDIYPWDEMQVGDSFLVSMRKYNSVAGSIVRKHKQGEERFVSRKVDDLNCRVWRVK